MLSKSTDLKAIAYFELFDYRFIYAPKYYYNKWNVVAFLYNTYNFCLSHDVLLNFKGDESNF